MVPVFLCDATCTEAALVLWIMRRIKFAFVVNIFLFKNMERKILLKGLKGDIWKVCVLYQHRLQHVLANLANEANETPVQDCDKSSSGQGN